MNYSPVSAPAIDTILVPQGAEYQAVCRGLRRRQDWQTPYPPASESKGREKGKWDGPRVRAVPMGWQALAAHLETWQQSQDFLNQPPRGILFLGLGGSLSPQYPIGDLVIYEGCTCLSAFSQGGYYACDPSLGRELGANLSGKASLARGLTCDRLVSCSQEKARLAQQYGAGVVDMESFVVLEFFARVGIPVAIARAISDGPQQTLPDLTTAINSQGQLEPLPLALKMLQAPLPALQLIYGSLRGLGTLTRFVSHIF